MGQVCKIGILIILISIIDFSQAFTMSITDNISSRPNTTIQILTQSNIEFLKSNFTHNILFANVTH